MQLRSGCLPFCSNSRQITTLLLFFPLRIQQKSGNFSAGAYEYIDVVIEGERLLVDIDFRSEFEIARSTRSYKCLLQVLPNIFVGKADRLQKIVHLLTEAAKQSLKKKGMPCPPWRKAEYVEAKWLSTYTRVAPVSNSASEPGSDCKTKQEAMKEETWEDSPFELNLVFGGENSPLAENSTESVSASPLFACNEDEQNVMVQLGEPLEIKHREPSNSARKITGLTSLIEDQA